MKECLSGLLYLRVQLQYRKVDDSEACFVELYTIRNLQKSQMNNESIHFNDLKVPIQFCREKYIIIQHSI